MSVHIFGSGSGKVSKAKAVKIDKAAQKHGASFITFTDPGTKESRFWFTCPNKGQPFDNETAKAVLAEVNAYL